MSMPPPPRPATAQTPTHRYSFDMPTVYQGWEETPKDESSSEEGQNAPVPLSPPLMNRAFPSYYRPSGMKDSAEGQLGDAMPSRYNQRTDLIRRGEDRRYSWPDSIATNPPSIEDRYNEYIRLYQTHKPGMTTDEFDVLLYTNGLQDYMSSYSPPKPYDLDNWASPMPSFSVAAAAPHSYPGPRYLDHLPATANAAFHYTAPEPYSPEDMQARRERRNTSQITGHPALLMPPPPKPAGSKLSEMVPSPSEYDVSDSWSTTAVCGCDSLLSPVPIQPRQVRSGKLELHKRRAQHTRLAKRLQNVMARNEMRFEQRPGVPNRLWMELSRMQLERIRLPKSFRRAAGQDKAPVLKGLNVPDPESSSLEKGKGSVDQSFGMERSEVVVSQDAVEDNAPVLKDLIMPDSESSCSDKGGELMDQSHGFQHSDIVVSGETMEDNTPILQDLIIPDSENSSLEKGKESTDHSPEDEHSKPFVGTDAMEDNTPILKGLPNVPDSESSSPDKANKSTDQEREVKHSETVGSKEGVWWH